MVWSSRSDCQKDSTVECTRTVSTTVVSSEGMVEQSMCCVFLVLTATLNVVLKE